jgi:hypothetical protein
MKEGFRTYLKTIGLSDPVIMRVESILDFYTEFCTEEIDEIFVSEYTQKDGSRVYENLWFFSVSFAMEAKLFMTKDDFDIAPIIKPTMYCQIQKNNYDFKKATDSSRCFLKLQLNRNVSLEMKASKENCDKLRDIILNYYKAKLMA